MHPILADALVRALHMVELAIRKCYIDKPDEEKPPPRPLDSGR